MNLTILEAIGIGILIFVAIVLSLTHNHKHHKDKINDGKRIRRHHRFRKYLNLDVLPPLK